MRSGDITVTDATLKDLLISNVESNLKPKIEKKIDKKVEDSLIKTGRITKFYPYLDKAEVQLDVNDQKIICKILHRYGGDLLDLYTPLEAERIYDDDMHEVAIIPKAAQNVCVLSINDRDSKENLILGYYQNKELVGLNPARPGNMKLMSITELNPFWIKFGVDGLELRLPKKSSMSVGDLDKDMQDVDFASADNVYTKEEVYSKSEVYTKEEVDELIHQAVQEALQNNEED